MERYSRFMQLYICLKEILLRKNNPFTVDKVTLEAAERVLAVMERVKDTPMFIEEDEQMDLPFGAQLLKNDVKPLIYPYSKWYCQREWATEVLTIFTMKSVWESRRNRDEVNIVLDTFSRMAVEELSALPLTKLI